MPLARSPYYLALLAFGLTTVSVYTVLFGDLWYAYNPDSGAFIEAARNLLAGKGLVTTPSVSVTDRELVPFTLWPPGFPSLVAAASALSGIPPEQTALWLSRGATALLPMAMAYALRPLLGAPVAAAIAVLALLSPYTLAHGYLAMTDLPFLLLIVLSFGLLQRAFMRENAWLAILISGLLAGFAYTVRNAGLAWFAAVAATLLLSVPLRLLSPGEALRRGSLWFLGVVIAASPMWIRNLTLAGSLGTYSPPPAGGDLVSIVRGYLYMLLHDLSGSEAVGLLAWDAKLFGLLIVPAVIAAGIFLVRGWPRQSAEVKFGLLLVALYLGAGSAMVIIAAIKWLGGVDPRLLVQYTWLILAIGAAAVVPPREGRWRSLGIGLGAALLLALLLGRVVHHHETYERERTIASILESNTDLNVAQAALPDASWNLRLQLYRVGAENLSLLEEIRALPLGTLAVSNQGFLFRIETGRPVRSIYLKNMPTPEALAQGLERVVAQHADREVWFALLPSNQMLKTSSRSWFLPLIEALPTGCVVKDRTQRFLTATCAPRSLPK